VRVLHVAQPTSGGLPRCLAPPVADQVTRGWEVVVASPDDGDLPRFVREAGARHLPWRASRSPGPSSAAETARLARAVRSIAPDLVHLHSSKAGLCGRLAVRGRLPTLFQPQAWSFHAASGPVGAAATAWERLGARWADAVVCVSEREREDGERAGIDARWRVVFNGVDVEAISEASAEERDEARKRLGLPDGPLALCVGRLARQKGQDVLLDAWPLVRERVPGGELALVGDGEDRAELEARGVDGVRFAGDRHDVPDWLAAADVVVSSSRWEGMSLVVMEAMARGRSVVATDVAGSAEQVGEEAGAIVPPERPVALAEAVAARLLNPALRDTEGRAGRERAVRRHDVRKTSAQLAAVYEEVLAARGA
jgi:glycosyltransferase involved in cell wall biosynthesis